jgi:uncharacterized membrane protein YcaP (DUF421 family)
VVLLVRVNGLRSLSKMTSFDFVMTIALGSLVAGASQAGSWSKFAQPMVAMAGLFLAQWVLARLRKASAAAGRIIQNEPVLLMRDGKILHEALHRTRVGQSDLLAKLRQSGVRDFDAVRAVVLETTGDVSVIHGESCEERLLDGVKTVERRAEN